MVIMHNLFFYPAKTVVKTETESGDDDFSSNSKASTKISVKEENNSKKEETSW